MCKNDLPCDIGEAMIMVARDEGYFSIYCCKMRSYIWNPFKASNITRVAMVQVDFILVLKVERIPPTLQALRLHRSACDGPKIIGVD